MRPALVVFSLGFLFSVQAYSEVTTVSDLVRMGLSRSLELQSKTTELSSSQQRASQVRLGDNPLVSIEVGNREKDGGGARQLKASVVQPLGLGRASAAGVVADYGARVSEAEKFAVSLALQSKLYADLYRFLAADEKAHHAEERVARFKEIKKFLSSRTFASPQKKTEALIVEGKIQILQKLFLHLRAERDVLWESLNTYFNLSERPKVNVSWFRAPRTLQWAPLLAQAQTQSPAFKISAASIARADAESILARNGHFWLLRKRNWIRR